MASNADYNAISLLKSKSLKMQVETEQNISVTSSPVSGTRRTCLRGGPKPAAVSAVAELAEPLRAHLSLTQFLDSGRKQHLRLRHLEIIEDLLVFFKNNNNNNITFKELAEVKLALVHQVRHNFLVKANDLKNQSLQQDHLSRFSNCSTHKTTVSRLPLFAIPAGKNILVSVSHSPVPGLSFSSEVCVTASSVLDCFSSPVAFSFLLIDCHFAMILVKSGKT